MQINSWLVLDVNLLVLKSMNSDEINHIVKVGNCMTDVNLTSYFFNIHQRVFNELNLLIKTLSPYNNVQCIDRFTRKKHKKTQKKFYD